MIVGQIEADKSRQECEEDWKKTETRGSDIVGGRDLAGEMQVWMWMWIWEGTDNPDQPSAVWGAAIKLCGEKASRAPPLLTNRSTGGVSLLIMVPLSLLISRPTNYIR